MPIPGVTISIAGNPVMVREGSFEIVDAINSISTCMFTVRDDSGLNHYKKDQQVSITDSIRGLAYTGFINSVEEDNVRPNTLIFAKVACRDNHAIPERRTYPGPDYTNTYAGPIAADQLNVLAADGITAHYASRRETTQSQFAGGTLTNCTATSSVGDGDLELSLAGSAVSITETGSTFNTGLPANMAVVNGALTQVSYNAVKIVATNSINNAGNTYTYVKIWSGSYAIPAAGSAGYFIYDMFVLPSSSEIKIGIDFVFSDGTTFRDQATTANGAGDIQGFVPHPMTDLSGLANVGSWYHREFWLNAFAGKTVSYVTIAVEGDKTGEYTGYFKNIFFANNSRVATQNIFVNAASLNTAQQLQNYGYSNTVVSVAKCYDPYDIRTSQSYSIDAAKISASTLISWTETKTNTAASGKPLNGSEVAIDYSLDGGLTYINCQNNQPLPDFPAGLSVAGKSIQFVQILLSSLINPEDSPSLQGMSLAITPSYNGTKTDVIDFRDNNTTWSTGTFSGTTNNAGPTLALSGAIRNWDDANSGSQSLFGGTGKEIFINNRTLGIGVDNGFDVRSRMDFAGTYANFTCEVDVQVSGSYAAGVTYRTTNWGNSSGSEGYSARFTVNDLYLYKGNNSTGVGSETQLGHVSGMTLVSGSWHRLKVVANGSTHTLFIDDVQLINFVDATYSTAGYVAAHLVNGSGSHQRGYFDNFGVTPALTGTWVSPSISLNALGTYYSSDLYYGNVSSDTSNCTILAEYSINGGSTWVTATNQSALPGLTVGQSLSGVSIKYRFTLTTTTASAQPALNAVCLKILGGFSASGTRISANLSLANVGRLGSSLVAWNATLPTGTTLGVDASVDGGSWTDVTSSPGGTIPGLTTQPLATSDSFAANTSANYTSTFRTSGSATTPTFDTANSRLTLAGGSTALYVLNTVTGVGDLDMWIDMDQSDAGGCLWRYTDVNNFYYIGVYDASSSSGTTNRINVYKVLSGSRTTVATAAINFVRGTYHRIRVNMQGTGTILVYFDSTTVLCTGLDPSLSSGKTGLVNDSGTSRYYQLRVQPLGQNVSSHYAQTRLRLASTDPTKTPQITDHTLSAFGNTIAVGALIPRTDYIRKYIDVNFDDLTKQCATATNSQWWWYIDKSKVFSMLPNTGMPSPWIASDNPGDFLDAGLTVTDESDLYRNRHIVDNVLATATINESRQGDNLTRSWTFGYQWAAAPTITVNGNAASVGIKSVDTGKQFYWLLGDATITQDAAATTYTSLFTIAFSGTGQYLTFSQADNTTEQAIQAALDGTSGIVENVEDGTGLTKAAGDALAQARLNQYSVRGKKLVGTTIHDGLAPGQLLPVFLPEHGIMDVSFLIRSITTHLTSGAGAGGQYQTFWYTIDAISGPDIGDWTKLYQRT